MLSVASNSTLVIFKVIVGALIGSVSIISEAIHSGMDLLAAIIAMFSVKKSHIPADDDHPFGHGKVESISGLVERFNFLRPSIIFEARKNDFAQEANNLSLGRRRHVPVRRCQSVQSHRLLRLKETTHRPSGGRRLAFADRCLHVHWRDGRLGISGSRSLLFCRSAHSLAGPGGGGFCGRVYFEVLAI